jgi:hypothetical protein
MSASPCSYVSFASYTIEVSPSRDIKSGSVEFPFEFKLRPYDGKQLFETYHGVYVNIQYMIKANMNRGMMSKALEKQLEFMCEIPTVCFNRISSVVINPSCCL